MEFVRRAATRFASRAAVSTTESDAGWATYGALVARAETAHARLSAAAPSSPSPIPISTPAGNSARVGPRVAVWAQPGPEFVAAAFACYMRGACVVPLSPLQPRAELARVLGDCGASAVLAPERALVGDGNEGVRALLQDLSAAQKVPLIAVEDVERTGAGEVTAAAAAASQQQHQEQQGPPDVPNDDLRAAVILYTSGSTGTPKGVVHSSSGLLSQADGLSRAWRVGTGGGGRERVVHALPLHHVHGLVNALHSPLASGGRVKFVLPRFSALGLWTALEAEEKDEAAAAAASSAAAAAAAAASSSSSSSSSSRLVFHGVPTMYSMLLEELAKRRNQGGPQAEQAEAWARSARGPGRRLFVCGSAACPPSLAAAWRAETGHALLERYGMTEAGMILSNPYDASDLRTDAAVVEALAPAPNEEEEEEEEEGGRAVAAPALAAAPWDAALVRRPGCVGLPLPGVEVRLVPVVAEEGQADDASAAGRQLTIAEALALEEEQEEKERRRRRTSGSSRDGSDGSNGASPSGRPPEAFYELRVRGPGLFAGYWRRPDATAEAFAGGGAGGAGGGGDGGGGGGGGGGGAAFFETGDVVGFDGGGQGDGGGVRYLRVVGRASADVIKPRGYKVSGLDVEAALLELRAAAPAPAAAAPAAAAAASASDDNGGGALVAECAVFGVPDGRYEGEEAVAALVRLSPQAGEGREAEDEASARARAAELSRGAAALLPPYALPRVWRFLRGPIPRNAMGKVNKRALRAALFPPGGASSSAGSAAAAAAAAEARWVGERELPQ